MANKFENLNKVGSRGKCMEDLRDVFWSMFEMFEVIGVLAVQRLAIKSAHRSTLRCVVSQQCKQLEKTHFLVVLSNPVQLSVVRCKVVCSCSVHVETGNTTAGPGAGGHRSPVSSSLEDC